MDNMYKFNKDIFMHFIPEKNIIFIQENKTYKFMNINFYRLGYNIEFDHIDKCVKYIQLITNYANEICKDMEKYEKIILLKHPNSKFIRNDVLLNNDIINKIKNKHIIIPEKEHNTFYLIYKLNNAKYIYSQYGCISFMNLIFCNNSSSIFIYGLLVYNHLYHLFNKNITHYNKHKKNKFIRLLYEN
jgi:hypothetical protein